MRHHVTRHHNVVDQKKCLHLVQDLSFKRRSLTAAPADTQWLRRDLAEAGLSQEYLLSGVLIARLVTWSTAPLDSCSRL